jgi:hypothetical protein
MFLLCTFEYVLADLSELFPFQLSILHLALAHNVISLAVFSANIPSFLV